MPVNEIKMKTLKVISLVALSLIMVNCNAQDKSQASKTTESKTNEVIHLNAETFKSTVFDYENSKEWNYLGDKPAILDFYADWCGPCKMLAPHLEAIQKEYGGNLQVYKINTDEQRELAMAFGIQSLPTIVFVPVKDKPAAIMGYREKTDLEDIINEVLKVQKPL